MRDRTNPDFAALSPGYACFDNVMLPPMSHILGTPNREGWKLHTLIKHLFRTNQEQLHI